MKFLRYIDKIVKSYGIKNYMLEKVRSVFKITSDTHRLAIKRFSSKDKMFNTKKILNHLIQNNFLYSQNVCYNLRNEFYFEFENGFYMCFEWIEGREINFKNLYEINNGVKLIYDFHEITKNINDNSMILTDKSNWIFEFENDLRNLHEIKKIILMKKVLSCLDEFYLKNIYRAVCKISEIIKFLNTNNFEKFYCENKLICHNSLYYQNFIVDNQKVFLIDFGGMCFNNRIYDIGRFARRVFYKNNFKIDILNGIYELYNRFYKFSEFEKNLFDNYLNYPYKFIKIGERFYLKKKLIDEDCILNKLKKYSKYELEF